MSNDMRSKYSDKNRHMEKLRKFHSTPVCEKEMKLPSSLGRKYQVKEKTQMLLLVNGNFCVS